MADLQDHQFELEGVTFGIDLPVHITAEGFKPGRGAFRTQDVDNPVRDGAIPGRDFKASGSWGFEMFTNVDSMEDALDAAAQLEHVWPSPELRDTPGLLTPLRYCLGRRTRVVYGRPRRWDVSPSNTLMSGMLPITADFQVFDPLHYSDVEHSIDIEQVGTTSKQGLRAPVRTPVRTEFGSTPQTGIVENVGNRPTWPILEFREGLNPALTIAGWKCQVLASLSANDEPVIVDTRPWVASSTRGGAFVKLSRDSRMQSMSLPPGQRVAGVLTNDSKQAAAKVKVRWRDAYSSL